jgi:flavin reductase (DIM6/NTAB) family NADH-FMN oxidoreductase RutF
MFRNAMGKFPTGVTVITTEVDGEPFGMTVNAFMSVSLNPKLVVISVGNQARMLKRIQQSKRYAINILSESQQELSAVFAGQKNVNSVEFSTVDGLPVLKDSIATITCKVVEEFVAGDHTLFFGEVMDIITREGEPLIYFQGKYYELYSSEMNNGSYEG